MSDAAPPALITRWYAAVDSHDPAMIRPLLAPDAVFRSPAVHTPQEGADLTWAYLAAAFTVLGPQLTYHREFISGRDAVLEFTTVLDGLDVHGVDMITWNDADQITEFTVMVRPFQALTTLIEHMGAALKEMR